MTDTLLGARRSAAGGFFASWFPFTRGQRWLAIGALGLLVWQFTHVRVNLPVDWIEADRFRPGEEWAIAAFGLLVLPIALKVLEKTRWAPHRHGCEDTKPVLDARRATLVRRVNDAVVGCWVAAAIAFTVAVENGFTFR